MRLMERMHCVPVFESEDITDGITGDSINMENFHHAVFILVFCSDLAGDAVLTIKSGASDGTQTTAETFFYRVSGADFATASSDVFAAETSSAGLTLTEASYQDRVLVCEIDADDITDAQPWLTLALSNAATAGSATCVALLEPRFAGKTQATALT